MAARRIYDAAMIRNAAIVLALALSGLVLPACSSLSTADQIRARDEKLPVVITAANISVPNAIDGVTLLVSWANTSTKPIKYVKFEAQPYNAVGDPVKCDVRKSGRREFTCTGPFNPGYPDGSIFDGFKFRHAWYNGSIRCVEIVSCEVIYMDNSSEIFQEADLPKIFAAGMETKCMMK
jgi:hypothetical protein